MIEQISYSVHFPPSDHYSLGRTFERTIDFQEGATNIVGPNEVGKTFNLEVIQFLLFGSKALRGRADDYQHFKADGIFSIRGVRYLLTRSLKNATLRTAGGEVMATGTKPVNARVVALLGYGLDVFQVANVALQGDSERLSQMLPAERKAMVDKLIGADQIETLGRWCAEQALGVSREIAGLDRGLIEPTAPVKPDGYRPPADLARQVAALRVARDRAVELRAFLANTPTVPELGEPPTSIPLATLDKAEQILGLRTYNFNLEAVVDQLASHELWEERVAFERQHPRPTLGRSDLEQENARVGLERDLVRLRKSPTLTCPCGKDFTTADAEIARIEAELAEIPVLDGTYDLGREANRLDDWDRTATRATWDRLKDVVETTHPEHNPRDAKGAVHLSEVTSAIVELRVTGSLAEVRALAGLVRTHQAHEAAYEAAVGRAEAWHREAAAKRAELAGIDTSELADLDARLNEARVYDAQQTSYQRAFADWAQGRDRLTDLRREEQSWRNGKSGFDDLREQAKTHLVPALSRVASYMLSEMTGGQRSRIVIDEDFDIMVDGQPLNTLSGSGKVCANLAIRFGLGRVLTNSVFPVFMGDEIDGSMDDDRADSLHQALFNLRGHLKQIIVITHKDPTFDQVIRLES